MAPRLLQNWGSDLIFARILIVEDSESELEELQNSFASVGRKTGVHVEFELERNKKSAEQMFDTRLFHIVSLDQSIPRVNEPNTSTVLGFELAKELAKKKMSFHGSIYTNVPEQDKMQHLVFTGFKYREKDVLTDEKKNCYTADDYAALVLSEFVDEYPIKVFSRIKESGLDQLARYAGVLENSYERILEERSDEAVTKFYGEFAPFFEKSLWFLVAFYESLAKLDNLENVALPTYSKEGKPSPALSLNWLKVVINALSDKSDTFATFEKYFTSDSNHFGLKQHFLDACFALKRFRNDTVHNAQSVGYDEHLEILPSLFRFLDQFSLWATTPIIYQPRQLKQSRVIDCMNLNTRFPSTTQIEFSESDFSCVDVSTIEPSQVLIRIPSYGLIPIGTRFGVSRDAETRVAKLDFLPWFSED